MFRRREIETLIIICKQYEREGRMNKQLCDFSGVARASFSKGLHVGLHRQSEHAV